MPLRDHFHPPVSRRVSWEGFHALWPGVIVQHLMKRLPSRYTAEPRVHLGAQVEVDVTAFEQDAPPLPFSDPANGSAWRPAAPTVAVETDLLATNEYQVRVYDTALGRRLVAAVELVSPANKDREEHRTTFVTKCAALLREGVSVSVVDLVTSRHFNLYADLLALADQTDPTLGEEPPAIYAAACRWVERGRGHVLETWSHALTLGRPLPTLPLWLGDAAFVPLELEATYEDACQTFRLA